jgi:O-antigen/teichoic acid export membrane protein
MILDNIGLLVRPVMRRLLGASLGPMAEFTLRFVRTVVLSRLLVPNDLGACIALGAIFSGCKLATDLGLDRYVVVFGREAPEAAIAAARQISIFRGLVLGLILIVFAPGIAPLFGHSVAADAVRWLALPLIIDGFRNWRVIQLQLHYQFGPQAGSIASAQIGALLAAVAAIHWFHDERVMLISLIAEATLYTITSHAIMPRFCRRPAEPAMRRLALRFGLPLMINGIALWMLNQFDRVVVVNVFGSTALAIYSLVAGLAVIPLAVLSLVASNLALPYLDRGRREIQPAGHEAALNVMFCHFAGAAVYAIGIAIFLGAAVPFVYGPQYSISRSFGILLSVFVFFRVIRTGINLILLANDGTIKLTIGNLFGGTGPLIGLAIAMIWPRIESVTLGMVAGDLMSSLALLIFARRALPVHVMLVMAVLFAAPVAFVVIGLSMIGGGSRLPASAIVFAVGSAAVLCSSVFVSRWRSACNGSWLGGFRGARLSEAASDFPSDS